MRCCVIDRVSLALAVQHPTAKGYASHKVAPFFVVAVPLYVPFLVRKHPPHLLRFTVTNHILVNVAH